MALLNVNIVHAVAFDTETLYNKIIGILLNDATDMILGELTWV